METKRTKQAEDILLYVPNIIGYLRLVLLLVAYFKLSEPITFLGLYGASASLDFFDGWAARALDQKSSFGAWLDVIIDNISRSLLWSHVVEWGWIVICVEWLTFVCNHQAGSKWKEMATGEEAEKLKIITAPPFYVQKVMENGFKTTLGTLVISGLHVLPVWIYGNNHGVWTNFIPSIVNHLIVLLLSVGRLICLSVELWCIYKHVRELLMEDQEEEVFVKKRT